MNLALKILCSYISHVEMIYQYIYDYVWWAHSVRHFKSNEILQKKAAIEPTPRLLFSSIQLLLSHLKATRTIVNHEQWSCNIDLFFFIVLIKQIYNVQYTGKLLEMVNY